MIINPKYHNPLIGEFLSCHTGYSKDLKIRENSASGGLITQLLCYLLEKEEIDGALVTRTEVKNGDVSLTSFIARTKNEIIGASGSHYLKANSSKVIKELLEEDGKFAVVGTPCMIRSLRKAQEKIPLLREKIYCLFGLFCGTPFNKNIFTYIYSNTNINKNNVGEIKFRDGWPNFKMRIRSITGSDLYLPSDKWIFFHDLGIYVDNSCINCRDALAEYADLSFGDAWLKEIVTKDNIGTSICICRTAKGEILLKDALNDGKIYLEETSANKVIESQRFVLYFKKLQNSRKSITFPTRFLKRSLSTLSNRYPDSSAKIPVLFYKFIFFFVAAYMMVIWKFEKKAGKIEKI